jgi:hypothetical protein
VYYKTVRKALISYSNFFLLAPQQRLIGFAANLLSTKATEEPVAIEL